MKTAIAPIIKILIIVVIGFLIGYEFGENWILNLSVKTDSNLKKVLAARFFRSDALWHQIEGSYAQGKIYKLEPELGWDIIYKYQEKITLYEGATAARPTRTTQK